MAITVKKNATMYCKPNWQGCKGKKKGYWVGMKLEVLGFLFLGFRQLMKLG